MKKVISLFVAFALTAGFSVPVSFAQAAQTPVIVETLYPTQDVVVADIIATKAPYCADDTGREDSTAVIQRAIDDCARSGGGTVFRGDMVHEHLQLSDRVSEHGRKI